MPLANKPRRGKCCSITAPTSIQPSRGRQPYTRYVAMHPLRGAAPDQKRCNAYGSGAPPPTTSPTADNSSPQTPTVRIGRCDTASTCSPRLRTRGAAPVTSQNTRSVAIHPFRRDAPNQKGCNAYGSGAPPPATSTTAKTFRLARSRAGCPSATGAALLSQFSSPGPGRPAATWRGERPRRRHPDPCRTGHLR